MSVFPLPLPIFLSSLLSLLSSLISAVSALSPLLERLAVDVLDGVPIIRKRFEKVGLVRAR
jgi:hypothetical protein